MSTCVLNPRKANRQFATYQIMGTLFLALCGFIFTAQFDAWAQTVSTKPGQPNAQAKQPFIEPAEMKHEKALARAFVEAAPQKNGRWDTLPWLMPINPVHVALMHNGKVLIIAG